MSFCSVFIVHAVWSDSEIWPRGRLRAGRGQRPDAMTYSFTEKFPISLFLKINHYYYDFSVIIRKYKKSIYDW